MANDAQGMRTAAGSVWKLCFWGSAALVLTFLFLALYLCLAPDSGPLPSVAAPGWPSVSC